MSLSAITVGSRGDSYSLSDYFTTVVCYLCTIIELPI
nr:MAG TPA: hypothetical protein [Caudoviricetes sp.]DAO43070.1 MAG TPA: hypothetical protein [Caudoviricetes sp.]